MAASSTVPEGLLIVHVCHGFSGWLSTVTMYDCPLAMGVWKANVPFAVTGRSLPPLTCRTSPVPTSPVTVPPMAYLLVVQFTRMLATSPLPTVPVPPLTLHVCEGLFGCALTVTSYAAPGASLVGNVKLPSSVTVRSSPALFRRTRPLPSRPTTVPPMAKVAPDGGCSPFALASPSEDDSSVVEVPHAIPIHVIDATAPRSHRVLCMPTL